MKNSGRGSAPVWDRAWRRALKRGRCIYGCSLTSTPCSHLETYLKWTGAPWIEEPPAFLSDEIDQFPGEAPTQSPTKGVYSLYRDLQAFGLSNDEILILIDRAVLRKHFKVIAAERGWTSRETLRRHYLEALAKLKQRGYRKEFYE